MSNQFKPGERAMQEVEVMFQEPPSKMTSNKTLYHVKIPYPFSDYHTCFVDAPILHPAPREGEYRLTRDEILDMFFYAEACAFGVPFSDKEKHFEMGIDEWLANRKEAGNE